MNPFRIRFDANTWKARLDGLRKQHKAFRVLLLLCALGAMATAFPLPARGQSAWSGNLRGTVLEMGSGKPVAEAEILVEQLQLTTISDDQGRFRIDAIALSENPLAVTVTINAPGFAEWRIEEVLLLDQDTLILNVEIG
ncbi:MAG: carboxypeptidase-like regulatory domain-containing protein, partial [Anaerolineales bacterium]